MLLAFFRVKLTTLLTNYVMKNSNKIAFSIGLVLASLFSSLAVGPGTVMFSNRLLADNYLSHVYGPSIYDPTLFLTGMGTQDTPAGTVDYAAAGMSPIGASGITGPYGAGTTLVQIFAAVGADQSESFLQPASYLTTFRTGAGAGNISIATNLTAQLPNVPGDSPVATLQLRVWDNSSGNYPTWADAEAAWDFGLIAAGKSPAFNVYNIGGDLNVPAKMTGLVSFNIAYIPEPSVLGMLAVTAGIWGLRGRKA